MTCPEQNKTNIMKADSYLQDHLDICPCLIYIRIMKARVIQQVGKENERMNCRSAKRKPTKSPLNIRQKIKELEVKLQQEKKATIICKNKQVNGNEKQPHLKAGTGMSKDNQIMHFQHIKGDRIGCYSAQKTSKPCFSYQQKWTIKAESRVLFRSKSSKNRTKSPYESPQIITQKVTNRNLTTDTEQLAHLKEENERYKRIYSHSLQKMHKLQARLQEIRQQHQAEKYQMESTMYGLKQCIENKKVALGHLYTHTQPNFHIMHDFIITETENQSSSLLENLSKRFQPSSISIESK